MGMLLWSNYDVSKSGHVMLPKKSGHVWARTLGRSVGILLQLAPDCQLSRGAKMRSMVIPNHNNYGSIQHSLTRSALMITDDGEKFTSEMHDPYTRTTVAWKNRTAQKYLQRGSGVEPAKYPSKVKSENAFTTLEC